MINLFKKIISNKSKEFENIIESDIIKCRISTPQFHGSQGKYTMFKQDGTFYKNDLKFINDFSSGHEIQFNSVEHFKKYLIKIYE